ncbi:lipase/serine esteras-like protein [Amniculicola lignicola CBS 123094]|uniref:Lipase/serine esteras-like protein n=1 Tax=Amniculicola lignicola CBS 123094 TaxID=1392246 RepID=A0A6A5X1M2_9PLEO|nr:lipase/serine esteras-like protein [Amniculicola lignicola CBS 123094]
MDVNSAVPAPTASDHLCVLVHGLWGNPQHLWFLTASLREKYPEGRLHILVAKRNSGSFTYDGIELGGERVASEIEETLEELARSGNEIKKLSVIGYSLGGLVSRYAIGLLFQKGLFEKIQPVNFTTFATPHLGVRTPLRGYHNHVWNVLGARTLSASGTQLFTVDRFRDTTRPILAVLADPGSVFIRGLALFQHRSLYANITGDRSVVYYTAAISSIDPYVDPETVSITYIPGYEDVIVDADKPVTPKAKPELGLTQRFTSSLATGLYRVPIVAFLIVFIPIGSTIFLLNSAVQSVRSRQRIQLHEQGKAGIDIARYRTSDMINSMRQEVEDIFENVNNSQSQEYLPADSEELALAPTNSRRSANFAHATSGTSEIGCIEELKEESGLDFPTLALTPDQFAMIDALDNVGFKKYPVFIHKHRHTHAAIVRRMDKPAFDEGKIVARHWLDNFVL